MKKKKKKKKNRKKRRKNQLQETIAEVLCNDKDSQGFEVGDPVKLLYTFATNKQR